MEPKNHQALKLKKEIESELTTGLITFLFFLLLFDSILSTFNFNFNFEIDGMIGAALVGGAIATIGIVAAALLSRK